MIGRLSVNSPLLSTKSPVPLLLNFSNIKLFSSIHAKPEHQLSILSLEYFLQKRKKEKIDRIRTREGDYS